MYHVKIKRPDGTWKPLAGSTGYETMDEAVSACSALAKFDPKLVTAIEGSVEPSRFAQLAFGVVVLMTCLAVGAVCFIALRTAWRAVQ